MIVEATEECRSSVLPYILLQEIRSTGMFVKEVADVVDISCDADQRPRLCLTLIWEANDQERSRILDTTLTIFPGDDWQLGFLRRPGECLLFLAKMPELDGQFPLLYFVVRERLQPYVLA